MSINSFILFFRVILHSVQERASSELNRMKQNKFQCKCCSVDPGRSDCLAKRFREYIHDSRQTSTLQQSGDHLWPIYKFQLWFYEHSVHSRAGMIIWERLTSYPRGMGLQLNAHLRNRRWSGPWQPCCSRATSVHGLSKTIFPVLNSTRVESKQEIAILAKAGRG